MAALEVILEVLAFLAILGLFGYIFVLILDDGEISSYSSRQVGPKWWMRK